MWFGFERQYRDVGEVLLLSDSCLIWLPVITLSDLHRWMRAALDTKTLCFGLRKGLEVILELFPSSLTVPSSIFQFHACFNLFSTLEQVKHTENSALKDEVLNPCTAFKQQLCLLEFAGNNPQELQPQEAKK